MKSFQFFSTVKQFFLNEKVKEKVFGCQDTLKTFCRNTVQYVWRNCSNLLALHRIAVVLVLIPALIYSILSLPDDAFLDFVNKNPSFDLRAYYLLFAIIATSLLIFVVCTFCFPMGEEDADATRLVTAVDWFLLLVSGSCMLISPFLLDAYVVGYIELVCGKAPLHPNPDNHDDHIRFHAEMKEYERCYLPAREALKYGYFEPAYLLCFFAGALGAYVLVMVTILSLFHCRSKTGDEMA